MLHLQNLPVRTAVETTEDIRLGKNDDFIPKGTLGFIESTLFVSTKETKYTIYWTTIYPLGIFFSRVGYSIHNQLDPHLQIKLPHMPHVGIK